MLTMGTSSFSKLPYFTRGGGVSMVLGNPVRKSRTLTRS